MKSTNRAESLAAAIADGERRGLKQGFGEILDEGLMSKAEVAMAYPVIPVDQIEAEIDKYLAGQNELDWLFGGAAPKPTRAEARERIMKRNEQHKAWYDAAPNEHIYNFVYYP